MREHRLGWVKDERAREGSIRQRLILPVITVNSHPPDAGEGCIILSPSRVGNLREFRVGKHPDHKFFRESVEFSCTLPDPRCSVTILITWGEASTGPETRLCPSL